MVCDGKTSCNDGSDEDGQLCRTWSCLNGTTKCADDIQCISNSEICDGFKDCRDRSDEMCKESCLKQPLYDKSIVRICLEDSTVCVPVERYCDRVADCPDGSDEADCSCEDWDMHKWRHEGINMCIYKQWINNESLVLYMGKISHYLDIDQLSQWQLRYQGEISYI